MPRPDSKAARPITTSPFENPFETNITRFGLKGINITDNIDVIEPDELSRMLNLTHRVDGGLTSRSGQTTVTGAAVGTTHHSIRRLNDPINSSYIRVHGIDTSLYVDNSGLSSVDSGYSGDPLVMVPYRPPFSSETWMFVADRSRMRKVRTDGLDLPIGLAAPGSAPTVAAGTTQKTTIANFTNDGSEPSNWTPNSGFTYDNPPVPTDPPTASIIPEDPTNQGLTAIGFESNMSTTTPTGYYNFWGLPKTMDLSQVGAVSSTDDDYIHLAINFSHTQFIEEFRIYLVCSAVFSPSILPGTGGNVNGDAYVKAISPSDFGFYVQAALGENDAAELARLRALKDGSLKLHGISISSLRKQMINAAAATIAQNAIDATDPARLVSAIGSPANDVWHEFATVGIPLRKSDFQRLGTTSGRDWSTITGIVVLVKTKATDTGQVGGTVVRVADMYLMGGYGPDSGEATASPYDYKYIHYDSRTGAKSNPSPVMADTNFKDALRNSLVVTPAAYGDSAIRQKFYRRGGTLPTDWFFAGTNSSDGGVFIDTLGDSEIEAAGSVEDDNYQPVATVDSSGTTVLNQPIPALWGPLEDFLFGCGDPYRPGHIYFCKAGEPDSWPSDNITEVCSPSEELQMGCLFGGQSFVFSKERLFVLYPNLTGDPTAPTVTSTVTQCKKGMVNRWGIAVGISGIYFIAKDGIYRTAGGPEEWLSRKIDPLFRGQTKNGMLPIDFSALTKLRLEIHENELYFQYQDTNGVVRCLVYSLIYQFWRPYQFGQETACFYSDEGNAVSTLLMGGNSTGKSYSFSGFSDDGSAISCQARTGALTFGRPREEKRLGDQLLDMDTQGVVLTIQNLLNYETAANAAQTLTNVAGRDRAIFDGFGTTPQRAETLSTDISWSSASAAPVIYWLGSSIIIEPDVTVNRVTQWDDLGHPDESYVMGITFDCDTGGVDRTIIIERDFAGTISTISTLTVNADGRHKLKFSWPAQQAHKVRIRPNDDCKAWILYKADWISVNEPPRIARWDTHFENGWDNYYTGLDLYCDTGGQNKTVEVYVDEVLIKTETVNTNGRKVHHITLPWGRGHVFRFVATDDNAGLLYDYRWHMEKEPSEQTNWNQNFTVAGMENDKYLKAIVFQCDTFGLDKTVTVECDGVVVETLTINTNGRKVVQKAFPQHLGRVFRVYPTDNNPGRLYSLWWVFDSEPLALDRWETQEIDHSVPAWHYPIYGHITLKSTATVTLTLTGYNQSGVATIKTYTISSTGGVKQKVFVPFQAMKGILFKYVLTSADPFWLYREETAVAVRIWGTDATMNAKPFGNDDLDPTRVMTRAESAAARSGGAESNG